MIDLEGPHGFEPEFESFEHFSDVDLLVEFLEEARPGLLGLSALGREFSTVLGRRVDVAVKAALKPLARKEILSEAHVIYAEG